MPKKKKRNSTNEGKWKKRGMNTEKAAQRRRNKSIKIRKEKRAAHMASKRMKAIKHELEQESNINSISVIESFKKAITFVELFIKKADYIALTENEDKKIKYELFAASLKDKLKTWNIFILKYK